LSAVLGDKMTYSIGAAVQQGIAELPRKEISNPVTGKQGVRVDFLDGEGNVIYTEDRLSTNLIWLGSKAPVFETQAVRLSTNLNVTESGQRLVGFASIQPSKITIDGQVVLEKHNKVESDDPFMALMDPPYSSVPFNFVAGTPINITVDVDMRGRTGLALAAMSFQFGYEQDRSVDDALIAAAVAEAKASELAIVVVGTNAQVESEGFDRKDLKLPGRQDELVEAVVAANPNTIVIVNSGSPVLLPWRKKVKAVLLTYFAGQEMGNAMVDMLTGATEPGGRLPTTWAVEQEDVPVINCMHDENNDIFYDEGIHIGYRAWLKAGTKPAYAFGYGLGYTTFELSNLVVPNSIAAEADFTAEVTVKNTGARKGKQVVQVYAQRKNSSVDRPIIWLVGFADVVVDAGQSVVAKVEIRGREFAHYADGWNYEAGSFTILAGAASDNLPLSATVTI
jgi:beta-glucosidase